MKTITVQQLQLIQRALVNYAEHLEKDVDVNEDELNLFDGISHLLICNEELKVIKQSDADDIHKMARIAIEHEHESYAHKYGYVLSALETISRQFQ